MDADDFLENAACEASPITTSKQSTLMDYITEMRDFENYQPPSSGGVFASAFTCDTRLKLYLMLFSCDIGTRDRKGRIGSQNGPKHFIDYLQNYDTKFTLDDAKLQIYYIGNLIEKYLHRSRFEKMITNVLEMTNQVYIGIGGSDDFNYYYIHHLLNRIGKQTEASAEEEFKGKTIDNNLAIVHFDSKIDMFGTMDAVTSINYFKSIFAQIEQSKLSKAKVIFIGVQSCFCPSEIIDEIQAAPNDDNTESPKRDFQVIWMRKDIRTVESLQDDAKTQAGSVFSEVLAALNKEGYTNIEVSFDLSVIKSEDAPGRSDVVTADGLTAEEAIEISHLAGKGHNVKSYIVTEFNPGVESKKTGELLMEMFGSFVQGANDREITFVSE